MKNKQQILAANWKMNLTSIEIKAFFQNIENEKATFDKLQCFIAPSPVYLNLLQHEKESRNLTIECIAQNLHWEDSGAFTGEISPKQLLDIGVTGSLIGHSERRQYFSESNVIILNKCLKALSHDLHIILCVGESLEERESNLTNDVLKKQLEPILSTLCDQFKSHTIMNRLTIAYEPVWAIGTGKSASTTQIEETHQYIHSLLSDYKLNSCSILYGGSVKPANYSEIYALDAVDGALVGGASLDPKSFLELAKIMISN